MPPAFDLLVRLPYLANILILVPVCAGLYLSPALEPGDRRMGVTPDGFASLVTALWSSILAVSALGLIWPRLFAPVLIIQIVYKSIFLLRSTLPAMLAGREADAPAGLSVIFLLIVVTYPVAAFALLSGH
jgi:hypothetical protein